MASTVEIPLIAAPQGFSVSLAGTGYVMKVAWNPAAQYWVLDIADANSVPLVGGMPMLPGADLLAQYHSLGIAGQLLVGNDVSPNEPPGYAELGTIGHLYFVPS